MRVLLKVLFVLVVAAAAAVFGYRLFAGRYPSPGRAAVLTLVLFSAAVAADAAFGW